MNNSKDKLRGLVEGSPLSDAAKQKAYALIDDTQKDFATTQQEVAALIAEEIQADMDSRGVPPADVNDPGIAAAREALDKEVRDAQTDLAEDLKRVDAALDSLAQNAETVQADALRASLKP